MENQDKNTTKPHPKPSDDAQSLVETIIPSTEDKASTTTKAEQTEIEKSEKAIVKEKDEKDVDEEDLTGNKDDKEAEKQDNDEGDKIETVAP